MPIETATSPARDAERLQELIQQAEQLPDPAARELVGECLRAVLELHGQGLARMLQIAEETEPGGRAVVERLIQDRAVAGLLLIHGLHPIELETRLRGALEKVRPYLESHGGSIELAGLEEETAVVRLQGTCKSCPSSAITLELTVRRAIEEACPDLAGLVVEGAGDAQTQAATAPGPCLAEAK